MSASMPNGSCCAVADPAMVPAAATVPTGAGDCAHPPSSPLSGGDVDLDAARLMGHPTAAHVLPACSAGFSLRIATANVCCFPLLTRNKTAVLQFGAGIVTGMALLRWTISSYAPWMPLLLQLLLLPILALPLLNIIIPIQAAVLLSRGTWHDHKGARLRLLLRSLDSLDCVALQELYSSTIDARYRNMVLREARLRGFHYAVPVARVPQFPATLLNAGTLILSRYAISHSASIVFPTKAFYDLVIVNRGASWARIQLPTGHVLHFFTCHLAPPLNEVAGRGGRLLLKLQCPQQKQLGELIDFMRDCIEPDRAAWEKECVEAAKTVTADDSSRAACPATARVRPFSVVLAGDFNLDCGSLRYFSLLHALHSLDLGMKDLFASEEEEGEDGATHCLRHSHPAATSAAAAAAVLHQGGALDGLVDEDEEEEEEEEVAGQEGSGPDDKGESAKVRDNNATGGLSRRRVGAAGSPLAPVSLSASAPASPPSPSPSSPGRTSPPSSPSRLRVAPNSWSIERGNGREPYSPELHAPYTAVMRSRRLHWQATFGQVLSTPAPAAAAPTDHERDAAGDSGAEAARLGSQGGPGAGAVVAARSSPVVHQETFLTHATLLGSHSTHDYIFSSLRPRATAVEPFLAPHALHRLLHHPDRQACDHAGAGQSDPDEAEAAAALADMYEGSSVAAAAQTGRAVPPYQQLSDHCALLATLMLPEESAAVRSRAATLSAP